MNSLNKTPLITIIVPVYNTKKYLKNISYNRKKHELDKIFASIHAKEGIKLLEKLDLLEELDLENLNKVKDYFRYTSTE